MSYKGKSSVAAFAAIALVYGLYFAWAMGSGKNSTEVLVHMIGTVVALTIILTIIEIGIAVWELRLGRLALARDERDNLNSTRSARNAYYVLLALIVPTPILVLTPIPPNVTANVLLAILVVAELVNYGSRAVYDLRGR